MPTPVHSSIDYTVQLLATNPNHIDAGSILTRSVSDAETIAPTYRWHSATLPYRTYVSFCPFQRLESGMLMAFVVAAVVICTVLLRSYRRFCLAATFPALYLTRLLTVMRLRLPLLVVVSGQPADRRNNS